MSQYTLPLPHAPVFSPDNFYVSGCNRDARRWLERWPDWPSHALLLYGPEGAGKTHLAHIWASCAQAGMTDMRTQALAPADIRGHHVLENIDALKDERLLLHTLNIARESGIGLLLTSSFPLPQLPFTLPDLTSRLKALPAVAIAPPDDEALAAALRKQFADRQLKVSDEAVAFLLPRMERSFSGAARLVEAVDKRALAEKRELTIPFLKAALGY